MTLNGYQPPLMDEGNALFPVDLPEHQQCPASQGPGQAVLPMVVPVAAAGLDVPGDVADEQFLPAPAKAAMRKGRVALRWYNQVPVTPEAGDLDRLALVANALAEAVQELLETRGYTPRGAGVTDLSAARANARATLRAYEAGVAGVPPARHASALARTLRAVLDSK